MEADNGISPFQWHSSLDAEIGWQVNRVKSLGAVFSQLSYAAFTAEITYRQHQISGDATERHRAIFGGQITMLNNVALGERSYCRLSCR